MSIFQRIATIFGAKANKALDKAENPNETLDYSYQKQLELLQKVRRGATGADLIPVLGMNGKTMLAWAIVTAVAFAWTGWDFWMSDPVPYSDWATL